MRDHLRQITITVPAFTQPTSPQVTPWPLEVAELHYMELVIPRGHGGQTGLALLYQTRQVVPWDAGQWVTTDGEKLHVNWNDEVMAAGFVAWTYNTDKRPHTFILRGLVTPILTAGERTSPHQSIGAPPADETYARIAALRREAA